MHHRQCMANGAARAERLLLYREEELAAGAVREVLLDLLAAVAGAKHEAPKTLVEKLVDQDVEKRPAGNRSEPFRPVAEHGLEPRAEAAAKDQDLVGLHYFLGLDARYQSIVRRKPSRRSTSARKPRSDCALCVSTRRNGIVVGLLGS